MSLYSKVNIDTSDEEDFAPVLWGEEELKDLRKLEASIGMSEKTVSNSVCYGEK